MRRATYIAILVFVGLLCTLTDIYAMTQLGMIQ